MDPFNEKDLVDTLRKIASSLEGIRSELSDLNVAFREFSLEEEAEPVIEFTEEDEDEDDSDEVESL